MNIHEVIGTASHSDQIRMLLWESFDHTFSIAGNISIDGNTLSVGNILTLTRNETMPLDQLQSRLNSLVEAALSNGINRSMSSPLTDLVTHELVTGCAHLKPPNKRATISMIKNVIYLILNYNVFTAVIDFVKTKLFNDIRDNALEHETITNVDYIYTLLRKGGIKHYIDRYNAHGDVDAVLDNVVATYAHELAHAEQFIPQLGRKKFDRRRYIGTIEYDEPADMPYDEYISIKSEITAYANGAAAALIQNSESLDDLVKQTLYLIKTGKFKNGDRVSPEIRDYTKYFNEPGTYRYRVYKRFMKQLYQVIMKYVEDMKHDPKLVSSNSLWENATAGATSSSAIGTVVNPHVAIGKRDKSYTGSPGKSGTTSPKPPKIIQRKTKYGTAVNALDLNNASLFGSPIRR